MSSHVRYMSAMQAKDLLLQQTNLGKPSISARLQKYGLAHKDSNDPIQLRPRVVGREQKVELSRRSQKVRSRRTVSIHRAAEGFLESIKQTRQNCAHKQAPFGETQEESHGYALKLARYGSVLNCALPIRPAAL